MRRTKLENTGDRVRSALSAAVRRGLLILPLALAAIWLSISVTGAAVIRGSTPALAMKLAPYDAHSKANQAASLLGEGNPAAQIDRASGLAKEALSRDPTVVSAWRSLALIAAIQGRAPEATKLMDFASRLSRRDMPTQLWLIEDYVRANDVIGTLQHYDIALRTSESGRDLLLPTLVASLSHDELVESVADLLATNPPWLPHFFAVFAERAPAHENTATFLEMLRNKGYSEPIPYATTLPYRLVTQGKYRTASRVHAALLAGQTEEARAADQFGITDRIPPFDWDLVSEGGVRADPQLQNSSDRQAALYVFGDQGNVGIPASRLFALSPGTHRLETTVRADGASLPERLSWVLECAGGQTSLAQKDVTPPSAGRRSYVLDFDVPPTACAAQWLRLEMRAADGSRPSEAWIERVRIRPTS
jgi:hypothetical protein